MGSSIETDMALIHMRMEMCTLGTLKKTKEINMECISGQQKKKTEVKMMKCTMGSGKKMSETIMEYIIFMDEELY